MEIIVKYYNSSLNIGFNNWREVYDCNNEIWLKANTHKGRLVYGKQRIPYNKIKKGLDEKDKIVRQYCPF